MILMAIAAGVAAEGGAAPLPSLHASSDHRASRTVATAGLVVSIAGPPVLAIGAVTTFAASPEVGITVGGLGVAGMIAGPPMLLGGTMRTARLLQDGGASVDRTFGWIGWGLYGGSAAAALTGVVVPAGWGLSGPLLVASVVMGGIQSLQNGAARRATVSAILPDAPRRRASVSMVPWVDATAQAEGRTRTHGVALAGWF